MNSGYNDSHQAIHEVTLHSEGGIYAVAVEGGVIYVLTVPEDVTDVGEVFIRRADGVNSRALPVFQATFTVGSDGHFYTDDGDGVKLLRSPIVRGIKKVK